jgi:phage shock protein E
MFKRNFLIILTIFVFMFSFNLFGAVADSINVDQYEELKAQGYTVIDVRTQEEFNEGHIKDAVLINFYDPSFKTKISELDKNGKYLVFCRSGNRSGKAVVIMNQMGIKDALNIAGGIIAWQKAGKPLVQ